MVWIIIISFLVIVIGKFFWDRYKMEQKIKQEGGMSKKYATLINLILAQDREARVLHETPSDISMGLESTSGKILINILATFKSITITYFLDSYLVGKHKLQWEFDKDEDQQYMNDKMNKDIGAYMDNINFEDKLQKGIGKVMEKYFKED